MKLLPGREDLISACDGVYTSADTARYFGVTKEQVHQVWDSDREYAEVEPPNIDDTARFIDPWDVEILYMRGMTAQQIAEHQGCHRTRVHQLLAHLHPYDRQVIAERAR